MAKGTLKIKIIGDDSDFKGKLSGVIGNVVKLGVAFAGAAIVGGLTAGAKAGIDFNSAIEQTTVSLSTMLGSQEKANDLIGEMTAFAAKTPYEFPELADSTKKLLAFGVAQEDIIPTMTMLGDISAGLGINVSELAELYGKAKVQGRLFAEDVNQLTGRGIPVIQEFAKQFGVSESEVRGLVEAGKIGFPELQTALESLTGESGKFGGLMAAQSQTFAGQWSTLKDTINQTMGQAMKPIFDWLTGTALPAAIELLEKFSAGFAEGGLLGGIKALFAGVGESMGGFMDGVQAIMPVFQAIWDTLTTIVSTAVETIKPIIASITDWVRSHWDEISSLTSTIWETIKLVITTALELIKVVVTTALGLIKSFWTAHGDEVMEVVTVIWDLIKNAIETVMGVIQGLMKTIMALIHGDWQGAWDAIKSIGQTIWDGIKSAASTTFNAMKSALSGVWDEIKSAFQGLWDGCKSSWDSAAEWIGAIPGKIKGFFSGAASWLTDIGRSIMDGLLSGIKSAWNSVANFLGGLGAKIKALKGPIEEDRKLLIPEGKAIMESLGIGMDEGWDAIEAKLAKYGAAIKAWGFSLQNVRDVVSGLTGVEQNKSPWGFALDAVDGEWFSVTNRLSRFADDLADFGYTVGDALDYITKHTSIQPVLGFSGTGGLDSGFGAGGQSAWEASLAADNMAKYGQAEGRYTNAQKAEWKAYQNKRRYGSANPTSAQMFAAIDSNLGGPSASSGPKVVNINVTGMGQMDTVRAIAGALATV
jgi:tape measure domain-containing protein